jgi:flavin reductase (DIM6/NTAB) family NADH-FMN oxidoreductase RutF
MNIKQLASVILIVSISFLAMLLTSCGQNAQAATDTPPAQAVTGASESSEEAAAALAGLLAATGISTDGDNQLPESENTATKVWRKIEPSEIKDNPVTLCDNWLAVASGKEGDMNAMTVGWMTLGRIWSDPVAMVYVSPDRYTSAFMERNEYFTITAFPDGGREKLLTIGTQSGMEGDKIKEAGLTVEYTELGNPAFAEGRLMLECRKIYSEQLDSALLDADIRKSYYEDFKQTVHRLYIGAIVNVWVKE